MLPEASPEIEPSRHHSIAVLASLQQPMEISVKFRIEMLFKQRKRCLSNVIHRLRCLAKKVILTIV
ncbi:hypothetical protein D3C85_1065650 [compost metagenome]